VQFCFACALKKGYAREEEAYGDHDVHTLDLAKQTSGCAHASVSAPPSLPPSSSPPAPAVQTGVSAWVLGSDPAGFAARIGLAGVIAGALLAGACTLKQPRRNAQLA
jgi:hypothetical protein